jgi:hypothetical protein
MNAFDACPSCACLVKRSDAVCPFCGATTLAANALPTRRAGRMSRAQWLAYASTITVVGCTSGGGATAPGHPLDAEAPVDATMPSVEAGGDDQAVADAVSHGAGDAGADGVAEDSAPVDADSVDVTLVDAGVPEAAGPPPLRGEGGFLCVPGGSCDFGICVDADVICDRATEWCFENGGGYNPPSGCRSLQTTCGSPPALADACLDDFSWDASAVEGQVAPCTGGVPRCACLTLTPACVTGGCLDDDAGGVTVSCGHCYGAPPARLGRRRGSIARADSAQPSRHGAHR